MNKNFYLETFGCQMNVVDSEQIVALLKGIGYGQVDHPEAADLILLNTCSVRDKAERKVYGHLGRFKPIKDQRPDLILAVGGCVAQQEGERMLEQVAYLDVVFGTHNIHRLPEMVEQVENNRKRAAVTSFLDADNRRRLFPQRSQQSSVSRYVTVMQGCDNFCSYCIVPHVRGREVSRPSEDILTEIRQLVAQGVREVTLLGQNVNSYGNRDAGEISFADLLHRVQAIEGLQRLRFATSHPKDLTPELIACFGSLDKLCKHMHLPLQSGSDAILKQMNRGYSAADYLNKVDQLRRACPEIRLTSDIIVGFPNESQADFQATLDLVEQVGYADAYTFLYSPREGTAAAQITDHESAEGKQRRFEELVQTQRRISREIWKTDLNSVLPVLVEGPSKQGRGQLFGRTTGNRIVNFSGSSKLVGRMVPVRITQVGSNSNIGQLEEPTEES